MAQVGLLAVCLPAQGQFYNTPKKDKTPAREKPDRDLKEYRDEADEVLAPLAGPGEAARGSRDWTIVIVAFVGEGQAESAQLGLAKVQTEAGLRDAYLERRDKATVIAYGHYPSPDDGAAQADLDRIRTLKVDGGTPFAAALLTPPSPEHLAGSLPELDLRNAKKLYGADKALYTLQVAIYGRPDRSPATDAEIGEYRKAAEEAAVLLRRDGELAFYYHAPERSMVTVGVFGPEDYDPRNRPGQESYPLILARERNPLNLLNGKGIRERIPGAQGDSEKAYRLQPSMLVAVPES
jgi:hypothetical protein